MKKNLIFTTFAYLDNFNSSVNIQKRKSKQIVNLYLKNALVTLKYARLSNPDDEVALITNVDIEQKFKNYFEKEGIKIFNCPFNKFLMPKNYLWSLAFYKFCALDYAKSLDYKSYMIVDSDVLFISNVEKIWKYTDENKICAISLDENITFEEREFTHIGGEFFAVNKTLLNSFLERINTFYNYIIDNNVSNKSGDEFFSSFVIADLRDKYQSCNDMVYRCWTGTYRDVPKDYSEYLILHFPAEKQYGMVKAFSLIKKGCSVSIEEMVKILHFYKPSLFSKIKVLIKRILKR